MPRQQSTVFRRLVLVHGLTSLWMTAGTSGFSIRSRKPFIPVWRRPLPASADPKTACAASPGLSAWDGGEPRSRSLSPLEARSVFKTGPHTCGVDSPWRNAEYSKPTPEGAHSLAAKPRPYLVHIPGVRCSCVHERSVATRICTEASALGERRHSLLDYSNERKTTVKSQMLMR